MGEQQHLNLVRSDSPDYPDLVRSDSPWLGLIPHTLPKKVRSDSPTIRIISNDIKVILTIFWNPSFLNPFKKKKEGRSDRL